MAIFIDALNSNRFIDRTRKTEYEIKTTGLKFWHKMMPNHFRVVSVAQCFLKCLDELETIPEGGSGVKNFKHLEWAIKIESMLKALAALKEKSESSLYERIRNCVAHIFAFFSKSSSEFLTIQDLENRLRSHMMAFNAFKDMGGSGSTLSMLDNTNQINLLAVALAWKKQLPQLSDVKSLTDLEQQRLEKTALHYSKFVDHILSPEGKNTANSFFSWVIKEGCDPDLFVLKPYTSQFLQQCLFAEKIGKAEKETGKTFLKFDPITAQFTLPLALSEGIVKINVCALDQQVFFKVDKTHTRAFTLKEIIQRCSRKDSAIGSFEFATFQPSEYAIQLTRCKAISHA